MLTLEQVKTAFPKMTDSRAEAFLEAAHDLHITERELTLISGGEIPLTDGRRLVLVNNGSGYWCSAIYGNDGAREHLSQGYIQAFEAARHALGVHAGQILAADPDGKLSVGMRPQA